MDNLEQVAEIKKYRRRLRRVWGITVDLDTAARLWVCRYAGRWRRLHPLTSSGREVLRIEPFLP